MNLLCLFVIDRCNTEMQRFGIFTRTIVLTINGQLPKLRLELELGQTKLAYLARL
jgi:hypothetical protein